MKYKYKTLRNIEEAIKKTLDANSGWAPVNFLAALSETKPGERENIVIAIVEPE